MKKFLIHIAIFFAIVAVIDFSLGKLFYYLQSTKAGGRTGAEYYACKKSNEDIIIMGSSRASHHYVPEIITEKTGMSCFNAGQDGNGIILQYGRWKMISERYSPKVIIYDITPVFDLEQNDNMAYVDRLKPFCYNTSVKGYVASIFPMENIKLYSNMYRYNYKFIEMSFDCISKDDCFKLSGYLPENGHIREEVVRKPVKKTTTTIETDSVKLFYLEQLVKEACAKGTKVVFVVSPYWKGGYYSAEAYNHIWALANKYSIGFIDYTDSDLCNNPDNFEDSMHLNEKGARTFTDDLFSRIQI